MTQKSIKETLETIENPASEPFSPIPAWVESARITPDGLRAARGLLDWSRSQLRTQSDVSMETIKNIEHGVWTPKKESHDKLVNALAEQGVEFFRINFLKRYGLSITGVLRIEPMKIERPC